MQYTLLTDLAHTTLTPPQTPEEIQYNIPPPSIYIPGGGQGQGLGQGVNAVSACNSGNGYAKMTTMG